MALVVHGDLERDVVVETVAKIRRAYFVQGKAIKAICRELKISRKVLRSEATEFRYEREEQPLPLLGPCRTHLMGCWRRTRGRPAANG